MSRYEDLYIRMIDRLSGSGDMLLLPASHLFSPEEDEQRIALEVTTHTTMSLEKWDKLKDYERVPWLEATISKLPDEDAEETVKPVGTEETGSEPKEPNPAIAVESLLGDESEEILKIARSKKKNCDTKIREICGIDRSYLAWDSPRWANLLGVTPAAIRKTPFWKYDRQNAIEAEGIMT